MKSHLFGAVSSMGCANIGLKGIADDYEHMYGKDAADFIRDCFYVDDGLCSVSNDELAADLIKRSIAMCKEGKIELAKFVCSSSTVLKSFDKISISPSAGVVFNIWQISFGLDGDRSIWIRSTNDGSGRVNDATSKSTTSC